MISFRVPVPTPWRPIGPSWRAAEVGYLLIAGGLATAGGATGQPWWYGAALLLVLPAGVGAAVASYLGYAILQGVGGLFLSSENSAGNQAGWLGLASATLIVLLVLAAAAINLLLLNTGLHRWARRRQLAGT